MRLPIRSWKNTWSVLSTFAPRRVRPSRNERRLARKRLQPRKKAPRRSRTSLFQQLEDRQLLTGTLQLVDGSTTLANGGSDSFGSVATGASDTKTFTVDNVGSGTLTVNSLSLPNGYSTSTAFSLNVPAGQSSTFTVSLYTGAAGSFNGPMTLQDSDSANTPFTVNLSGTVTSNASPVMTLRDGSTVLTGGSSDSFGSVSAGTPDSKTFSVSNSGSATLTVSGVSLPSGFTLGTTLPLNVPPGQSSTFVVNMNTASVASYSGQMSISDNDPTHNPLAVNISGTVTGATAPTLQLVDGSTVLANGASDSFVVAFPKMITR